MEKVFCDLTREVTLKLSQAGCGETTVGRPAYTQDTRRTGIVMKRRWWYNLQFRYTAGFVLVQTARMNEISSANKRVVTVITLLRQSSVDLHLRLLW